MTDGRSTGKPSDEALLLRARAGEEAAMEALMSRYKPLVRKKAAARYLLGGDRDDLLQEGMIGLYKAVRDYEPAHESGASFATFAATCIERQILRAIEATQRQKNRLLNESVPISAELEDIPEPNTSPEQLFLDNEITDELLSRISSSLSKMEREVLTRYLEGYDYREIASQMQKEPKSIDNALQRIRRKAQAVLSAS